MLHQHDGETHQPMMMPENRVRTEPLARYQGTEYDREFMELTIHHHNSLIALGDRLLVSYGAERAGSKSSRRSFPPLRPTVRSSTPGRTPPGAVDRWDSPLWDLIQHAVTG